MFLALKIFLGRAAQHFGLSLLNQTHFPSRCKISRRSANWAWRSHNEDEKKNNKCQQNISPLQKLPLPDRVMINYLVSHLYWYAVTHSIRYFL